MSRETRANLLDAILVCCGDIGYRQATVELVQRSHGSCPGEFYRYFDSKAECYLAAYEAESARLCEMIQNADGATCRERLETALQGLADFAVQDPLKARGLLVEVHVAGGEALAKRQEVLTRLARTLDEACREPGSRHSSPPMTAEFMVNAVEHVLLSALASQRPDDFSEAVPDLAGLIHQAFRGDESLS